MKLTALIFSIVVITSFKAFPQSTVITGETSKEALMNNSTYEWFNTNYNTFKTRDELISEIKKLLKKNKYTIEVYFGTWCSDSQREIPRLIKILDESKFKYNRLKLVGVDRDKVVPDISDEQRKALDIDRVPTIIIYEDGQEVNRFVEYARESLEQDLIKILSKEPYKHSYY